MEKEFNREELTDDTLENVSGGLNLKTTLSAAKAIVNKSCGSGLDRARIDLSRCSGCGTCFSYCPIGAIDANSFTISSNCHGYYACGHCVDHCPFGAIVC